MVQKKLGTHRIFLREFFRRFHHTGSILPSSRYLAQSLAKPVVERPSDEPIRILEVGPGTGSVTQQLVQELGPQDRLDLVEINEEFVRVLQQRLETEPPFQDVADRVQLLCQPVEDVPCEQPYDVIISGLPLNNFEVAEVEGILNKFRELARPGARVSFFEYVAIRLLKSTISPGRATRARLQGITKVITVFLEAELSRDTIWRNVPPAWVHHVKFADKSPLSNLSIGASGGSPSKSDMPVGDDR